MIPLNAAVEAVYEAEWRPKEFPEFYGLLVMPDGRVGKFRFFGYGEEGATGMTGKVVEWVGAISNPLKSDLKTYDRNFRLMFENQEIPPPPQHCCGASGFELSNDLCPACEYWKIHAKVTPLTQTI